MSKYQHIEEVWRLDGNPFPSEAIHYGDEPYNPHVFKEEQAQFFARLVHAAAMDRRGFGYLWSKGRSGDTGFGKTALMRNAARIINTDAGETVFREAGMRPERLGKHRAVAAYASLSTTDVTGLYPILFAAVEYLADPKHGSSEVSTLDGFRTILREKHALSAGDAEGLRAVLQAKRRELGATLPPVRTDALDAFCTGEDGDFASFLGQVSPASRTRNGLAYFDFVFTVAAAAGVRHFFVFVDQLEDLAMNRKVTQAKRSREVGRLRDVIAEMVPFVGHVHFVFTFHIVASQALLDFWMQNRLPSFDPEDPTNAGAIVVLQGIRNLDQARELIVTYLDARREDGPTGELAPFAEPVLPALLERSGGRPGILLALAHKLFDRAAEAELPEIDGRFARDLLGTDGTGTLTGRPGPAPGERRDARALDELLR